MATASHRASWRSSGRRGCSPSRRWARRRGFRAPRNSEWTSRWRRSRASRRSCGELRQGSRSAVIAGILLAVRCPPFRDLREQHHVMRPVTGSAVRIGGSMDPLTHLQRLEAESIHIMREVVAECDKPVMLYSIGKDSVGDAASGDEGVLSRRKPPFPLLHVDTTWKFREMIAFRDELRQRARPRADRAHQPGRPRARHRPVHARLGRAHRRHEDAGAASRRSTSTASTPPSAARGATRKSRAPRSASSRSAPRSTAGIRSASGPSSGASTTRASTRAKASACSRCRTGPSSTSGSTSTARTSRSCRCISPSDAPGGRARRHADHGR